MVGIRSTKLRERLDAQCGATKRVTVFWSCGDQILCTTGRVVDIFDDVLVVLGFTATSHERLGADQDRCEDCNALEVVTFINLDRVCAVVARLPHCRQACLPHCCNCQEHRMRGRGDGMD